VTLPTHARVVIVGGGIAGASTAYHLARLGVTDVVLLEQGKLTCGTTWHAAGLVGQTRATRNATRMSRYGIELYAALEQETGLATGWKQCGSLNVAATPERMKLIRRQMARAQSFGVEFEYVTPAQAGAIAPILRTDDLAGAVWIPGDGKANPTDLTQSLAKGARMRGVAIHEGVRVTGRHAAQRPGQRASRGARRRRERRDPLRDGRQLRRPVGARVRPRRRRQRPAPFRRAFLRRHAAHRRRDAALPVIRDPDGFIYYKEEVGGLVMGGFEPVAKPWNVEPIPDGFEFQLLAEDWDQFEPLMRNAIHRTPCLETAEIRMLLNGPESFTLDGNFILGEAPELPGYFVCAGFNSAGIANSGGAGRLIAEWIVGGEAPHDVFDIDVRRFTPLHANRLHLSDRTVETLGLHYAMRWPREELVTVRPLRRSPLYDRLKARGAVFGTKLNWERANYFLPAGAQVPPYTLDTPGWLPYVLEEQRACREDVVVFDQTSFSKFVLKGRDALAVLQRLCANDVDVAVDRMVYTRC
jgi:4-methylaminobutanoate oxidase (formaldehyde-forming)